MERIDYEVQPRERDRPCLEEGGVIAEMIRAHRHLQSKAVEKS